MPNTPKTPQEPAPVPLSINLSELPALLDAEGVRKHLAPVGRTLLYSLATRGEIQTASLGLGRGKRVFTTASIVEWLAKRMAQTKRPNMALRRPSVSQTEGKTTPTGGSESTERE